MNNSTGTNGLNSNGMEGKINFLREGTYDILTVTKSDSSRGMQYIAEVRRFSNGQCNYENVNLLYLFNKDSLGPKMQFQPGSLIDHVINITACIPQRSSSGKTYYSYNWEINTELTQRLQDQLQELISDQFLMDEVIWKHEQYLRDEQNIQDHQEWLLDEFYRNEQNIEDYQEQLIKDELLNEQNLEDYRKQLIEDEEINEQRLEDEKDHQRDQELDSDDYCDIDED